jgi:hypothetical protein
LTDSFARERLGVAKRDWGLGLRTWLVKVIVRHTDADAGPGELMPYPLLWCSCSGKSQWPKVGARNSVRHTRGDAGAGRASSIYVHPCSSSPRGPILHSVPYLTGGQRDVGRVTLGIELCSPCRVPWGRLVAILPGADLWNWPNVQCSRSWPDLHLHTRRTRRRCRGFSSAGERPADC